MSLYIEELIQNNLEVLDLHWVAGEEGAKTRSIQEEKKQAAADMIGHLNNIHPSRIQVFGAPEMRFFTGLSPKVREKILVQLDEGGAPAIIVADNLSVPADVMSYCARRQLPLLSSPDNAAHVIEVLRIYLGRRFAPCVIRHGVFLDVFGLGVLITGESGLGKSELALELISRGHGLVADDAVEFYRSSPTTIDGICPELLRNLLEVRGLGLLDIRTIFGETSVRRRMRLKLIVHLVRANVEKIDRLPIQDQTEEVLGLPVRRVMLQVAAGRNLAVLVEAAARNTILKLRGIDTLREFMERQSQLIRESSRQDVPVNPDVDINAMMMPVEINESPEAMEASAKAALAEDAAKEKALAEAQQKAAAAGDGDPKTDDA